MNEVSPRKLITDCGIVMHDVQDVVRTMAGQAIQRIGALRQRRELREDTEQLPVRTKCTAEFARDSWTKVALATGIGLIVGLLMRRIVKRIG